MRELATSVLNEIVQWLRRADDDLRMAQLALQSRPPGNCVNAECYCATQIILKSPRTATGGASAGVP
jgi:hypothetical protein